MEIANINNASLASRTTTSIKVSILEGFTQDANNRYTLKLFREFAGIDLNNVITSMTADQVAAFATWMTETKGYKLSSVRVHLHNVSALYKIFTALTGEPITDQTKSPLVKLTLKQLSKTADSTQKVKKQARAITMGEIIKIVRYMTDPKNGISHRKATTRNRALILLTYFGGNRISETCEIEVENISFEGDYMRIELPNHKTAAKTGKSLIKWYKRQDDPAVCPVVATQDMLTITQGRYLFKGTKGREFMTRATAHIALTKLFTIVLGDDAEGLQTHSFRRGRINNLIEKGATIEDISAVTSQAPDTIRINYIAEERKQASAKRLAGM